MYACGGAAFDFQLAGQAECRHAVDQAEIDGFGVAALLAATARATPNTSAAVARWMSSPSLNACSRFGVAGKVRHDAQLDLRIIGRNQLVAGRRDECLADAAAFGGAHRIFCRFGSLLASRPVLATACA